MQQTPPKSFQTISHHNTMKTTTTSTSSIRGLVARIKGLVAAAPAAAFSAALAFALAATAASARTVSVAAVKDGAATAAFGDPDGAAYTLAWGYGPADGGAATNAWAHFETLGAVAADATAATYPLPTGWDDTATHLRFFLLEPELPTEATRVEYLESSGTQWINSGVNLGMNDTVVADYAFSQSNFTRSRDLFGVYQMGMTARYIFLYSSGSWTIRFDKANGSSTASSTSPGVSATPGSRQTVTMHIGSGTSSIVSASGETLYSRTLTGTISQNATSPLGIFTLNNKGSFDTTYACAAKIYAFRIYDENNALRLDLVPCTVGGTPAMYDRVTGDYLSNVGTGDFATGATMATPLLVAASSATASTADYGEPDAYLDYVEATGTQSVLLEGCTIGPDYRLVAEYAYPDPIVRKNNCLFGVYKYGMTAGFYYSNSETAPLNFWSGTGGVNGSGGSNQSTQTEVPATPGERQTVVMNLGAGESSIYAADGRKVWSGTLKGSVTADSTSAISLFTASRLSGYNSNAKIYSFRIYDGTGALAHHFLPCLKGSVAGLYDKATGKIHYPQGGDLVAGPVLPRPATFVKWVQSDGADGSRGLYVDTEVPAKAGTGMTAELLWPVQPSVASTVCGAMADSTHHFTLYTAASTSDKTHQIGYANYAAFQINNGTSGVYSRKRYRVTSSLAAKSQNLKVEDLDGTGYNGSRFFNDANAIDAGHSLYLFARNDAGTPNQLAKVRLYSLVLTNELGLVRDFVPCVADNGRAGLYDRVSERVFFPQAAVAGAAADFDFATEVGAATNVLAEAAAGAPAARLSYVESDGASDFVDLGVIGKDGMKMVAEMEWVALDTPATFCGAASGTSSLFTTYRISTSDGTIMQRMGYANGSRPINSGTISPVAGTRYRVTTTLDDGAQSLLVEKKVDGVWTRSGSTDRTDAGPMDTGLPLTLFARNLAGVPDEFAAARVYSLKLWQKNASSGEYELVRDLVPAKGPEGGAALWDRVGKRFYRNSGDRYGLSAGSESQWIDGFIIRVW